MQEGTGVFFFTQINQDYMESFCNLRTGVMLEIRKLIPASSIYRNNLCRVLKYIYVKDKEKICKYACFKFSYSFQLKFSVEVGFNLCLSHLWLLKTYLHVL